jgi:hypothetical protein
MTWPLPARGEAHSNWTCPGGQGKVPLTGKGDYRDQAGNKSDFPVGPCGCPKPPLPRSSGAAEALATRARISTGARVRCFDVNEPAARTSEVKPAVPQAPQILLRNVRLAAPCRSRRLCADPGGHHGAGSVVVAVRLPPLTGTGSYRRILVTERVRRQRVELAI